MSRAIALAGALALSALLAACPKETKETPSPGPATDAGAKEAATAASTFDGPAVVKSACLSCHTEEMLKQQRLTQPQWTKVVTKMASWGATLEAGEVAPLAEYLAKTYGPDAGPYELEELLASEALVELTPSDDGPLAPGDLAAGKPLFTDKCSGCHGADARGNIGVNLVERPILYRAADFARIVRTGKGKMTPTKLEDKEIADVLAHLRSLKVRPPPPPPK